MAARLACEWYNASAAFISLISVALIPASSAGTSCVCPPPTTLYAVTPTGARACRLCPFFANAPPSSISKSECRCEDGRAMVNGACVQCAPGSFSAGGNACQTCPVGFVSGTGATSCTFDGCPFGFQRSFNGENPGCEPCGVDQYPTRYGCGTCPKGSKVNP